MDSQAGPGLFGSAQPNRAFTVQFGRIPSNKDLLTLQVLHECAVRALVDEHELATTKLHFGMNARDEIALHDKVVIIGAADVCALALITDFDRLITKIQDHFRDLAGAAFPLDGG